MVGRFGAGSAALLGAYFVQTGHITMGALLAAIPSGILVHNLLLLNEFPTRNTNHRKRRTLRISIGKRTPQSLFGVKYHHVPLDNRHGHHPLHARIYLNRFIDHTADFQAINGSFKYDDRSKFIPAMAANVMTYWPHRR